MAEEKDPLAGYVQTLLELRDREPEHPLDEASLKEIARDLGLDEGDWARLEQTFNRHMRIGGGFARLGNYADAAAEFERALKLKPGDMEARFRLAESLAGQWKTGTTAADRERAVELARAVLHADPGHEGALRLVSELRTPASEPSVRPKRKTVALLLVGLLTLFGGAATYWVFMPAKPGPSGDHPPLPEAERAAPAETRENPPAGTDAASETAAVPGSTPTPVKTDLPVQWPEREEIQFQTESSRYRPFIDAYSYQLTANLAPADVEITGLTVRVTLRNQSGESIFQRTADVLADHHPPAWPGDVIPMGITLFQKIAPPVPGDAAVEIVTLDQRPARTAYPDLPAVSLDWAGGKPAGVDLRVTSRQSRFSEASSMDKRFHRLELGVENVGTTGLKSLKFRIEWQNEAGEKLAERTFYAAATSGPLFAPGQRRSAGGTFGVPREEANGAPAGAPAWSLSVAEARY